MARRWISYRQAGMIVNALHGRDRYGRKRPPKPIKVTQDKPVAPIEPISTFFILLFYIFGVGIFFPNWKIILPLVILDLVIVSLISKENKANGQKKGLNYKNSITLHHKNGIAFHPPQKTPYTGIYEEFFQNGNKKCEISYVNGKQNGIFIKWYENGQKSMKGFYNANGCISGPSTSWYKNGQKWSEINYDDGVKNGVTKLWNQDGTTKIITTYKDGCKI